MVGVIHTLWLAAALVGANADAATSARPLHLVTEPIGADIRIRVVGESAVACEANYVLEVSNKSATGSNRSVQRGAARLRPGAEATFSTVTLVDAVSRHWTARLSVHSCGRGERYDEAKGALR